MPAARAASSREAPSSTSAKASIRRAALASRHRAASRRSSTAPGSFRVIATVMAPPLIGHTADQPRRAPRGSERDDRSAIRAVGITPEQEAELATAVERGPDPERDGVVRWRRVDLQALIETRFTVRLHERSVGKVLRRLGFSRVSVRPRHPKADEAAQEAFKKASPSWWRE